MPSRLTVLKPGRVNVTLYVPGRRSTIRYTPWPSVTTLRTFSISAGLAASTWTPGRTPPDESLTVPEIAPFKAACAQASPGSARRPSTTIRYALFPSLMLSVPFRRWSCSTVVSACSASPRFGPRLRALCFLCALSSEIHLHAELEQPAAHHSAGSSQDGAVERVHPGDVRLVEDVVDVELARQPGASQPHELREPEVDLHDAVLELRVRLDQVHHRKGVTGARGGTRRQIPPEDGASSALVAMYVAWMADPGRFWITALARKISGSGYDTPSFTSERNGGRLSQYCTRRVHDDAVEPRSTDVPRRPRGGRRFRSAPWNFASTPLYTCSRSPKSDAWVTRLFDLTELRRLDVVEAADLLPPPPGRRASRGAVTQNGS